MARGIHLKELKSADLDAIGVPDDGLPGAEGGENGRPVSLLAEVDPVLSQILNEVRQGLETTLELLDEALTVCNSTQAPPPKVGSPLS